MTQEELNKVLEAHKHYLEQDCEGWEKMHANLRGANLSDANLSDANLYGANLSFADLSDADLNVADLCGADLYGADLRRANLRRANLYGANLRSANLSDADLRSANLSDADLSGANLRGANLNGADLRGAKYDERTACFALVCPEEGDFVGWKKVGDAIVKLRIPAEAKRSSATTRKCRCEYAEVLELQSLDGTPYGKNEVINTNHIKTTYKVGELVRPDSWDDNRWNECSHGIHFFITRDEAVRYNPL